MYITSKARKYGINTFILTDAKMHCYNAEIYCGKDEEESQNKLNKPTRVVMRMVEPIMGINTNLTGDNWFTYTELLDELRKKGLTYAGTIRKNKSELPIQFTNVRGRPVPSSMFTFSGNKTLVSFVPKRGRVVN